METRITFAAEADVPEILNFIRGLARFEKLEHEVRATEETLRESLFGARKRAEVIFFEENARRVGFALFFHNFSTFLGRPGLYLEDLYVVPEMRGKGYGKRLLAFLAKLAVERGCGRFEWSVLDWNESAIRLYASLGAQPLSDWTGQRLAGDALQALAREAAD
jgi:GNAT superfamily N-acetyltransferase